MIDTLTEKEIYELITKLGEFINDKDKMIEIVETMETNKK